MSARVITEVPNRFILAAELNESGEKIEAHLGERFDKSRRDKEKISD